MHFDGRTWTDEHVGPKPKRPGRGADILHSSFRDVDANLVAHGPTLLLVRKADQTWETPAPAGKHGLLALSANTGTTLGSFDPASGKPNQWQPSPSAPTGVSPPA